MSKGPRIVTHSFASWQCKESRRRLASDRKRSTFTAECSSPNVHEEPRSEVGSYYKLRPTISPQSIRNFISTRLIGKSGSGTTTHTPLAILSGIVFPAPRREVWRLTTEPITALPFCYRVLQLGFGLSKVSTKKKVFFPPSLQLAGEDEAGKRGCSQMIGVHHVYACDG